MRNRWCTALKREAFNKKVGHKDIVQYHGIAFDEKHRVKENIKYPLVDWQITKKQALQYCYDRGLTWDGLYEDFSRVSCFCCPLSSLKELRVVFNKYPEIWNKIKEMDRKSFRKFRSDYSIDSIEQKFIMENKIDNILKNF